MLRASFSKARGNGMAGAPKSRRFKNTKLHELVYAQNYSDAKKYLERNYKPFITSKLPAFLVEILELNDEQDTRNNDIDVQNSMGFTPLNLACYLELYDMAKLLIEWGAALDIKNYNGFTALASAAQKGNFKIVELLIENGADADCVNSDGFTPLQSVLKRISTIKEQGQDFRKFLCVALYLVGRTKEVDHRSKEGYTALHEAADAGILSILKLLIEKGANINNVSITYAFTPLIASAHRGHTEVTKMLLDCEAKIDAQNSEGFTALNTAARHGHVDVVKLLVKRGANVCIANYSNYTAFRSAFSGYMNTKDNKFLSIIKAILGSKKVSVDYLQSELRSIEYYFEDRNNCQYKEEVKQLLINRIQGLLGKENEQQMLTKPDIMQRANTKYNVFWVIE